VLQLILRFYSTHSTKLVEIFSFTFQALATSNKYLVRCWMFFLLAGFKWIELTGSECRHLSYKVMSLYCTITRYVAQEDKKKLCLCFSIMQEDLTGRGSKILCFLYLGSEWSEIRVRALSVRNQPSVLHSITYYFYCWRQQMVE